jgi:hypothetical protein
MLGWDWCGFHKKHVGTRCAEVVFFNPMGSASDVVHSGVSLAQNIDAQFFMLGWDRYGFDKRRTVTRYAKLLFLYLVASAGHVVHYGASRA